MEVRNKDIVDCERYISKMRLVGLVPSNSFFSDLDETYIKVNPISLAIELGYPEVLRIPDFVSIAFNSYMTDDEVDYNKLNSIKKIILSNKLAVDKDLVAIIKRFRGLEEVGVTEGQYHKLHSLLGNTYKYTIQ